MLDLILDLFFHYIFCGLKLVKVNFGVAISKRQYLASWELVSKTTFIINWTFDGGREHINRWIHGSSTADSTR